jgi:hypothetical protein
MCVSASCGNKESCEKPRWYYKSLNHVRLLFSCSALLQESLADRRLLSEAVRHPLDSFLIKEVIVLVVDYIGPSFSAFLRCFYFNFHLFLLIVLLLFINIVVVAAVEFFPNAYRS